MIRSKSFFEVFILAAIMFITACKNKREIEAVYVTPEHFDFNTTWTADGTQLVFSSTRNHHPTLNLYIMNKDGSNQTQLTFEEDGYGSCFADCSPDGTKIAFISDRETGFRSLYVMNMDGTKIRRLSGIRDTLHNSTDFSSDGKLIYAEVSNGQGSDVYAFDSESGEKTQITDFDWGMSTPNLSPDGNYLAVATGRWGNPEIELFNLKTKTLERLTNSWSDEGAPIWSNNGEYIYIYSNIDEPMYEIYRVNVITKKWERISDSPNWDLEARVSPMGDLAFHSTQTGRNTIVVSDSLGRNRTLLTNKRLTPFITIAEEESFEDALGRYPRTVVDSLNGTYMFHEELLGLADRLIEEDKREEATQVLDYILARVNSGFFPDMTTRLYHKLGVKAPIDQGDFFRFIQKNGIEAGVKKFKKTRAEFPGRKFFNAYEMIMFAYSHHYKGEYRNSIALLKMNLELYPKSFQTLHDIGQSFEALGEVEEAAGYYMRSIEMDSTDSWYSANARKKLAKTDTD